MSKTDNAVKKKSRSKGKKMILLLKLGENYEDKEYDIIKHENCKFISYEDIKRALLYSERNDVEVKQIIKLEYAPDELAILNMTIGKNFILNENYSEELWKNNILESIENEFYSETDVIEHFQYSINVDYFYDYFYYNLKIEPEKFKSDDIVKAIKADKTKGLSQIKTKITRILTDNNYRPDIMVNDIEEYLTEYCYDREKAMKLTEVKQ